MRSTPSASGPAAQVWRHAKKKRVDCEGATRLGAPQAVVREAAGSAAQFFSWNEERSSGEISTAEDSHGRHGRTHTCDSCALAPSGRSTSDARLLLRVQVVRRSKLHIASTSFTVPPHLSSRNDPQRARHVARCCRRAARRCASDGGAAFDSTFARAARRASLPARCSAPLALRDVLDLFLTCCAFLCKSCSNSAAQQHVVRAFYIFLRAPRLSGVDLDLFLPVAVLT